MPVCLKSCARPPEPFFVRFASIVMALLESKAPEHGAPMPPFDLPDVGGGRIQSTDLKAEVLVVMFICAHCPYVQAVEARYVDLAKHFQGESVQFVGICANDPADYPADRPEALHQRAQEKGYTFPYLFDSTQEVAKAFDAVCTPEFYVYDKQRQLAYHGRLDDNWKDADAVEREELKAAIQALIAGEMPTTEQHPSMGCSIKWKQ